MSKYSDYVENIGIDWFLGNAVPAAPADHKLHVFNGSPDEDGTGGTDVSSQVNGVGGVAVSIVQNTTTPFVMHNLADITFNESQNAVDIDALAIKSGSNFLCYTTFTQKSIQVGNEVLFPLETIQLTFSGWLSLAKRTAFSAWLFGGQTLAALTGAPNYWVAPFDGDPEDGGSEVTGNTTANARIQLTFSRDSNNQASNTNEADFGKFTANTDVDYWALYDAQVGGNLIHRWNVTEQSGVSGEDSLVVKVGNYIVKFD